MTRARSLGLVLLALLATLLLAACGGDDSGGGSGGGGGGGGVLTGGSSEVGPAAKAIPAASLVYVDANIKPEGDLKTHTLNNLGKLLDKPGSEVPAYLRSKLDETSSSSDVKFGTDIEPWLGSHVAIGVTSFKPSASGSASGTDATIVAAVEVTDGAKAMDAFKKGESNATSGSYNGVDYLKSDDAVVGVVDKLAILGSTEESFKQGVDTAKGGSSIADDSGFKDAIGQIEGDRLGAIYVNLQSALKQADSLTSDATSKQALDAIRKQVGTKNARFAMALTSAENAFVLDGVTREIKSADGTDAAAGLVADAPADSWGAIGLGDLGVSGKQLIDQLGSMSSAGGTDPKQMISQVESQLGISIEKDFLSWMGPGSVFVRGSDLGSLGGAVVITAKDEAGAAKALDTIARIAGQAGQTPQSTTIAGAKALKFAGGPAGGIVIATKGDKFIIAMGEPAVTEALEPKSKLGDSADFKAAQGQLGDTKPILFLSLPAVAQLLETSTSASSSANNAQALNIVKKLGILAAGSKVDGDNGHVRAVITLK